MKKVARPRSPNRVTERCSHPTYHQQKETFVILSPCARKGQASRVHKVAEPASQAGRFFKLTGIIPATIGMVEVRVINNLGEEASVVVPQETLTSYTRFQRALLRAGVVFVNPAYEHGFGRFRSWRGRVDHLLVYGGSMKATA
jgi:hypothetical protein